MIRVKWREKGSDFAALTAILLFFALFFRQAIFGGRFFLAGDPITYSYPLRSIAWEMIRHGELPLWTPLILSGYPLLSMAQLGLAYPLTWGYLLLPGYWAEQLYVLAPYLLAPIFTYAYARKIGRSPLASLLAGLGFGYGGLMFSPLGSGGYLPNAVMWTPLVLLAIERSRSRRFIPSLLLATFAFTMSVLSGVGQGFTYAGALALAYGIFLSLWPTLRSTWKPFGVIAGAVLFSTGLAAFQIWESLRAAKLSVRHQLAYDHFSEGSFEFSLAWKSIIDPIHHKGDVMTYVPLIVVIFAIVAVVMAFRVGQNDPRIWFWLGVSFVAFVLILGSNTPIYPLVHQIPFINRFRVPSRHSFEWTFALSILGAYGWDAARTLLTNRRGKSASRMEIINIEIAAICLLIALYLGLGWWKRMKDDHVSPFMIFGDLDGEYLLWKLIVTALLLITIWTAWKVINDYWRFLLSAAAIALICLFEPLMGLARWVEPFSYTKDRFSYFSPLTNLVRQQPPNQSRYYPQISIYAENHAPRPAIDPVNWSVLAGVQSVAGYEPLILERYSRALNSSEWDNVSRAPFIQRDRSLFEPGSHVLNLLNVGYLASYSDLGFEPVRRVEKDGIKLSTADSAFELSGKSPVIIQGGGAEADTLAIVSALSFSNHIADGVVVANIKIRAIDGKVIERSLRAGDDTAEWAHERPDVRASIRHRLAPVFDTRPGDEKNSFPSHRYWARINLGECLRVRSVEFDKTLPDVSVVISWASLYDSRTGNSTAIPALDYGRWEPIHRQGDVILFHNKDVLPRAWLVSSAEAVDQTQSWAMIRGIGKRQFDPRYTALLELEPSKMPQLSGAVISADSRARVTEYHSNRLAIETESDQQTVLVVSEINYPGWVATIDGAGAPIHQTNYLLRGVVVRAGKHRIEMRYTAPGARSGAVVSLLSLLVVVVMLTKLRTKESRIYMSGTPRTG